MKNARQFFIRAIEKKRVAHLYLVHGPKGSGKEELVLDIAYQMMKKDNVENEVLRQQIIEKRHVNLVFIEPDGLSIKKEQILLLQQEFSKTTLTEGPRVYIVKGVEKMTQSAANSLLKFMEEPIGKNVFGFLLTEDREAVIRTIISRSQLVQLQGIGEKELENQLLEASINPIYAALLPYLTKNVDEAIALANNPSFKELIDVLIAFTETWHDTQTSLVLFFAKNKQVLILDRTMFQYFLELLVLYFLDIVHYKIHQELTFTLFKESMQKASNAVEIKQINEIIHIVQELIMRQTFYINIDLALDELAFEVEKRR
ncbi:MAG: hypothetical protein WC964_00465 [Acholeplasmataceae bacterium]